MKKSLLLLPLTVVIFTACSSNTKAPIENAGGLTPGVMEPVGHSNTNSSWQPEIQQVPMPANSQNNPPPQPNVEPVQPSTNIINCDNVRANPIAVPRNPATNAPDYSRIEKGSYKGSTYRVNKGDTMFLVAYLAGMDVKELAALNHMSEPYNLSIGQILKVGSCIPESQTEMAQTPPPPVTDTTNTVTSPEPTVLPPVQATTSSASTPTSVKTVSNVSWQWPTNGNIIQSFSSADGGNKGVDISGSRGQAVKAAASGRVVYAGNALRGYGNLIIIKHNDDFLSAYAHNDKILVSDQQQVKAGQEIAKMGSTGTNAVKLHFEIRYKGKSVDPTRYLPEK